VSAPRKLTPEAEAAIREWYVLYQDALTQLHGLGSVRQKAREHGVDVRTINNVVKREQYELTRKMRECGVRGVARISRPLSGP